MKAGGGLFEYFDHFVAVCTGLFSLTFVLGPLVTGDKYLEFAIETAGAVFIFGSLIWLAATIYLIWKRRWWFMLLTIAPLVWPWITVFVIYYACWQGECI